VIALVTTLVFFVVLVAALAPHLNGQPGAEIVLIAIIGLPVVTVNLLLPLSRWEQVQGDVVAHLHTNK
jgi:Zn-dependent protease with chaperone function